MTPDQVVEAAEVTAFWQELGLPGLVDVHVHFMPTNVLAKVWAFFAEGKGRRPWPVAYPLPEDERLELLRAFGVRRCVPVVVHCGSGPTAGLFTGPGPISEVLARHPRLTMIVAHMGAPEYGDFLDLADRYPGVHLDTTMVFSDFMEWLMPFPRDLLPRLAALGDRIVLGTDFPNIAYRYVHQLHALAKLELGDDWLRAVCYHNPVRLIQHLVPTS